MHPHIFEGRLTNTYHIMQTLFFEHPLTERHTDPPTDRQSPRCLLPKHNEILFEIFSIKIAQNKKLVLSSKYNKSTAR